MCRTANHKYVRRFYEQTNSTTWSQTLGRRANLIDDAAYGDVLSSLKERMLQWFMETSDVVPHEPDRRQ